MSCKAGGQAGRAAGSADARTQGTHASAATPGLPWTGSARKRGAAQQLRGRAHRIDLPEEVVRVRIGACAQPPLPLKVALQVKPRHVGTLAGRQPEAAVLDRGVLDAAGDGAPLRLGGEEAVEEGPQAAMLKDGRRRRAQTGASAAPRVRAGGLGRAATAAPAVRRRQSALEEPQQLRIDVRARGL